MGKTAFFSAFAGSVDRENGVIRGVSVITTGEAKGHPFRVDSKTLQTIKECAEAYRDGVQVKVNHGTGFDSIVGTLRNFRIEGEQLRADLHLLKETDHRAKILEIAEEIPGSVGLSISFSGDTEKIDGAKYARCLELYSVDFVDHPAANPSGLFSARVDSAEKGMSIETESKSFFAQLKEFVGFSKEFVAPAVELENKLKAKESELTVALGRITELETAKNKADADLKAATEKLGTFDAEVKKAAASQALGITAAQGQPPISQTPAATPAAEPKKVELKGLAKVQASIRAELAAQGVEETKLSKLTK